MPKKRWVLVLLTGVSIAVPAQAQWKTPWAYQGEKGADHWADLDPAYATCGTGKAQTPIDIRDARKAKLPALHFAYKDGPINIVNNGYTAVRVDYRPGNGNVLTVGDKQYELTQFHFHHPSEEYLRGKPAPMGMHFMHQASDGTVIGVAVFVTEGKSNPAVATLWAHMPQSPDGYHVIPGVTIDPGNLLPKETGYYVYDGSLSAPPCTENVTWYVLKTPIEMSAAQIATFAKLYPHDVRPIQKLNGRVIRESE